MALVFLAAIGLSPALAQAAAEAVATPVARDDLGKVHFATSCQPAVEKQFDQAMVFLYAFWAKDAIAGFKTVLQQDPDCAMAYWGIAMALQQNPLTAQQPGPEAAREALAGLDTAKRIGVKTQRETDYLAAVDAIYRDADKVDFPTRRRAYEKAMEALAQRYPDDSEAQVFYALSLDMTASLTDKPYANQLKAAAILERILAQQPDHPGVAHCLSTVMTTRPLPSVV